MPTLREYYREIDNALAARFIGLVEQALDDIRLQPLRYRQIRAKWRKCALKQFPYDLVFRFEQDQIQVMAIRHRRRHPDFGMDRV